MSTREKQQRNLGAKLMGNSAEAVLLSAPVLNAANDNQHGAQLTAPREGEDSVTSIKPEPRLSWGPAILACAAAALVCAAGWLYVVSAALLDNVTSLVN